MVDSNLSQFVSVITSYPTVVFSVLLGIAVLYWICASLGLLNIHLGDLTDHHHGMDHGHGADQPGNAEGMAGLLAKLGLNGVPLTLIIAIIAAVGWMLSFYISGLAKPLLPIGLAWVGNSVILLLSLYLATWAAAFLIRPLRPLFKKAQASGQKILTGRTATVRSLRVDSQFGEAELIEGGASIIVKVRTLDGLTFARGEKVVLLESMAQGQYYTVISEAEFISGAR